MHVIQRLLTLMFLMCCLASAQDHQEPCSKGGQNGVCVTLGQCRHLMAEIKIAGSVAPISDKLKALNCGYSNKQPRVCCIEIPATEELETSPITQASNRTFTDISDSYPEMSNREYDFIELPPDVSNHRNLRLLPTDCGPMDEDRIIRGKRVDLFEMPWMVLFAYRDLRSGNILYKCGGTLISRWYVLTAAHCVSLGRNSFTLDHVVLGEHDVRLDPDCVYDSEDTKCTTAFNHTIETSIVHPGYANALHGNDIALLKLNKPADITLEHISPICLPLNLELQQQSLVGENGLVAGWGTTEDGEAAPVLNSVGIPLMSNRLCDAYFKGTPKITSRQLCTLGQEGQDTCTGDSGGPLLFPGRVGGTTKQVQRAVVSYGAKQCAVKGHPSVYTNVAYYMKWILDSIDQ